MLFLLFLLQANVANQAIPLVKQVKPVIGNAKTMFKIMNEFKKDDLINNKIEKAKSDTNSSIQKNKIEYNNGPIFYN